MSDHWQTVIHYATELRHRLHRAPELPWQEHQTAALIRAELRALGLEPRPCADTGTLATLAPNASGRHVALRGDIDALPITEQTLLDYASEIPGRMHACGHDGHTAALLGAARWLKAHEHTLPGPVTLLFQPAEEGGHGAEAMIRDGALEGVDVIFGWHNWPAIEFGHLACPPGLVMSGNGTFTIEVLGEGGHASQPEVCRDPVLAGSAIVLALQQIVSRRLAPQTPVVVSVTSFEAPSGPTITPAKAVLSGGYRIPDDAVRAQVEQLITEIASATAAGYGCTASVHHTPRYGATINHPEPAAEVREIWREAFGEAALRVKVPVPLMASEDFSYYLRKIPGAFALIGADDGPAHRHSCHSPYYDFNDRLLSRVIHLYARLAGAPAPPLG